MGGGEEEDQEKKMVVVGVHHGLGIEEWSLAASHAVLAAAVSLFLSVVDPIDDVLVDIL